MNNEINAVIHAEECTDALINIIRDISFLTNLLALNVSIEAAKTGARGSEFSIVAREARNLAIKIQDAVTIAVKLINAGIRRANGEAKAADKTGEALERLVIDVTKASGAVSGVSKPSIKQIYIMSQINDRLGQISKVVRHNSAASVEAVAEELSGQLELLRNIMVKVFDSDY
jgi:methyl-accepting chemotaxis protein